MTRLLTFYLLFASLAASALGEEEIIEDPVRDYFQTFETTPNERIVTSRVDLNGDGADEVLITRSTLSNGRQGNIWVLYESLAGGGWKRRDETTEQGPIEFHQKAVSVQPDRGGRKKLVGYSAGNSVSGVLTSFSLSDEGIVAGTGGTINAGGDDAARYRELFANPATQLQFEEEDAAGLRQRYLPFGGWFLEITLGKLIFLLLCVGIPIWIISTLGKLFGRKKRS